MECLGREKEIPKEAARNKYGARREKLKLKQLRNVAFLLEFLLGGIPNGASVIEGGFVYTVKNKPLSAGYGKTGAYLDENQKIDARFFVKGF